MSLNTYYTLGQSGLRVSRLALGTITFGNDWGWGAAEETAHELLNTCVEGGISLQTRIPSQLPAAFALSLAESDSIPRYCKIESLSLLLHHDCIDPSVPHLIQLL